MSRLMPADYQHSYLQLESGNGGCNAPLTSKDGDVGVTRAEVRTRANFRLL